MRSTIVPNDCPFPQEQYLMESKELVILVTGVSNSKEYLQGFVIGIKYPDKNNGTQIGHHSVKWSAELFKPFYGQVILEND